MGACACSFPWTLIRGEERGQGPELDYSRTCTVCYTKHEIAWENSKVITTNNRYGQRLWLEEWHINMSNHAFNRDDGAYLPEEYMHLIGR